MSIHQHATIEDTVYFWFAANDLVGEGSDGATPVYDVRLAGAAAGAVPVLSGAGTLLTHVDYPPGCHEVAIAATAANGFAANETYAVFCTLLVDGTNPTGFVGSFTLTPLAKAATALSNAVWTNAKAAFVDASIAAIPTTAMRGTDNAALAATALSDAVWTGAKAAFLDAAITSRNATVPDSAGTAAALHAATDALIADRPTVAQFNARSIVAATYATAAAIAALPTAAEIWALAATIDGKTPAEALQIIAAAVAGKVSGVGVGAAPWTEIFVGLDGATPRIVSTVDATFNRTAVTY